MGRYILPILISEGVMKYMGSKNRHAKEILPIIFEGANKRQIYVEPFVGGFNMMDKVEWHCRVASDSHPYLVSLFHAVRDGWQPPSEVSEDLYKFCKDNPRDNMPLTGFVGFGCSYSGKWFGGYARGNNSKGEPRNYALESKRNILKQAPKLKNVQMFCYSYDKLYIEQDSLIYCDPPYKNTTGYKDDFEHDAFWDWVRKKTVEGHSVFVSEYVAPNDFECLWSKEVNNTLIKNTGGKVGVEKLFKFRSKKWV